MIQYEIMDPVTYGLYSASYKVERVRDDQSTDLRGSARGPSSRVSRSHERVASTRLINIGAIGESHDIQLRSNFNTLLVDADPSLVQIILRS